MTRATCVNLALKASTDVAVHFPKTGSAKQDRHGTLNEHLIRNEPNLLARRCGLMPFKSEAKRRYFEANKAKLEKHGVDVKEWEESSRGLKLPQRAPKRKSPKKS